MKKIQFEQVTGSINGKKFEFRVPKNDTPAWNNRTKLIKKNGEEILFTEIWLEGKSLFNHSGTVGEIGKFEKFKLSIDENVNNISQELVKEKISDGFKLLEPDDMAEILVQYNYEENEISDILEKRQLIQIIIDRCLFATCNGYCDGGGMGMGVVEIYNYVIDIEKGMQVIIEELKKIDMPKGTIVSYHKDFNLL